MSTSTCEQKSSRASTGPPTVWTRTPRQQTERSAVADLPQGRSPLALRGRLGGSPDASLSIPIVGSNTTRPDNRNCYAKDATK